MIFAELTYEEHYDEIHEPLLKHINLHFKNVKPGHQGDSWIWIYDNNQKVTIDTFSSMKHQIKSDTESLPLVQRIIETLQNKFDVDIYEKPELEPHEE